MTHQQALQQLAPQLLAAAQALEAARRDLRPDTVPEVSRRLGRIEHDLYQLECACRFSGAMPEETRQAFEGAAR